MAVSLQTEEIFLFVTSACPAHSNGLGQLEAGSRWGQRNASRLVSLKDLD